MTPPVPEVYIARVRRSEDKLDTIAWSSPDKAMGWASDELPVTVEWRQTDDGEWTGSVMGEVVATVRRAPIADAKTLASNYSQVLPSPRTAENIDAWREWRHSKQGHE